MSVALTSCLPFGFVKCFPSASGWSCVKIITGVVGVFETTFPDRIRGYEAIKIRSARAAREWAERTRSRLRNCPSPLAGEEAAPAAGGGVARTLVISGADDPATPPPHGQRIAGLGP